MDYEDHIFKEAVNDTVDRSLVSDTSKTYIIEETVLLVFALMGIVANLLLIYVCCYYRKLHTNTNVYLINWAIADCGSALITLTFFRMFSLEIPHQIICFYVGIAFALIFNEMLFMVMFTVDWCLTSYFPRPLEKFRKYTKGIVAVAWIVAAFYSLESSFLCTSISSYYLIFHISLPLIYFGLLLFVVVLHGIRIVQKIRKKFDYHPVSMLLIPSAFVCCGFLSWINLLILDLPDTFYMVTETPVFLHPTFNLLLLIMLDNDFKLCFFQVIKRHVCPCSCPSRTSPETVEKSPTTTTTNNGPISFDNKIFDAIHGQNGQAGQQTGHM